MFDSPIQTLQISASADLSFGERKSREEIEFHSSFRFTVTIDGITKPVYFSEFKLPTLEVKTDAISEGGQNSFIHYLPTRVDASKATLRHGITQDVTLLGWYLDVLTGEIEKAKRHVNITMFDMKRNPLITWNLRNAYPTRWEGPTLKSDSSTIALEAIDLVHHGIIVQTYS